MLFRSVTNTIEMGMKSWDDVVVRLKAIPGYGELFAKAFTGADAISADNAAKAIAVMAAQPSMIKRPLLDLGHRRVLGFKPELYEGLF